MTTRMPSLQRTLAVGAEFVADRSVSLRVWAPKCRRVEAYLFHADDAAGSEEPTTPPEAASCGEPRLIRRLDPEPNGYFSAVVDEVGPGERYAFRLDGGDQLFADPASRFQPRGPLGLSQFVHPRRFDWTAVARSGPEPTGQVVYELHVGTFTTAGTWQAAAEQLPELKSAGITVVEIMPVADFPGRFGWGYDGVAMFAPTRLYGTPDDFRRFVDRAHAEGLGVILDIVYNHFGNFGNYLGRFADDYYTDRYRNEWASAVNFDGPNAGPVREFFLSNARYWIAEFHLDGFRFDATQCIYDASPRHILAEVGEAARAAADGRTLYLAAENEAQQAVHLRMVPESGYGLDALWNDDFHHTATVRLTGKNPAYYSDYRGSVEELLASVKYSFLYQGQRSQWQEKPRGTPTRGIPASAFISYLQNHDQVANSATGERIHALTSPGRYRAMAALWLLAPQTPLFFQGQEFGATAPFLYFADFSENDGELVARGRLDFLAQFPTLRCPEARGLVPDPRRRETFERCRLNFAERETNRTVYDLHRDLLRLRRDDPIFRRARADLIDGARLSEDCLVLRYFDDAGDDRLVIVNFGADLLHAPAPQPLLAPPAERDWDLLWTSEDPRYGGGCSAAVSTVAGWRIPGEAAVVMQCVPAQQAPPPAPGLRTHAESAGESIDGVARE